MPDFNDSKPGKFVVHLDNDIREIIPMFLAHRARDVQTIRTALEQSDFETIQVLGHKMKGTGSGYGFDGISEMGDQLELAAKNREGPAIQQLLEKLVYYLDNLEIVWVDEED